MHPPLERLDELGARQAIHHRPFHLRKVQANAHVVEVMADGLEALERRHVDGIDRRAHQHDIGQPRVTGNLVGHQVFEIARIGEIEAFVDADGQHTGHGVHLVPLDIAEMLGAGHLSHNGGMRPRRAVEEDQDGRTDAQRNPRFDAEDQRPHKREGHGGEIGLGIGPGPLED